MLKYIALLRNLKRHLVFKKAFMSIWVHHWATDTSGSQFNFYFETGPCLCSSDQVQTCDSPYLSLLRTRMACPAYRFFFLDLNIVFTIVWGFICVGTGSTVYVWRSEGSSVEWLLSFLFTWVPESRLRSLGLETSAYSAEPSHQLSRRFLKQQPHIALRC